LRIRTNPPSSAGQKGSSATSLGTGSLDPQPVQERHKPDQYESISRWKWPIEASAKEDVDEIKTTTPAPVKLSTWTPQLNNNDANVRNTVMFRIKPHPFADYQRYKTPGSSTISSVGSSDGGGGGWMSLLAASLKAGLQQSRPATSESLIGFNQPAAVTKLAPTSITQWISSADESITSNNIAVREPVHTASSWPTENQREVITTKGNKISLITGSSNKQKLTYKQAAVPQTSSSSSYSNTNVFLPPEVSVSSHVIGLRVKPKSLDHTFVEQIQGVAVETDGEDVNLSDLIMKEPLTPPRSARFFGWQGQMIPVTPVRDLAEDFRNRRQFQPKIDGASGPLSHGYGAKWRPIYSSSS